MSQIEPEHQRGRDRQLDRQREQSERAARRAGRAPSRQISDTNKGLGALVRTFQDTYNGEQVRSIFLMMLCAVGFVLLIACAMSRT